MKIGFDISQTGALKAGCGYFADGLVRALGDLDDANSYLLYPTFGDRYWDPDWPHQQLPVERRNFKRGPGHGTHEALQRFWSAPPAELATALGAPEVVHANNFYCPRPLPGARLVYTLYDLNFIEQPDWTTEENRTVCLGGVFDAGLYADLLVAISAATREHYLRTYPHYPAERVRVVYPGSRFPLAARGQRPARLGRVQPDGYWLMVGTLEPRKNHLGLLTAYARLKARQPDTLPLVLAGGKGWLMERFEQRLAELDLADSVLRLGYVDDAELQWLYAHCHALVYPSFFEGFGLPVLEAMACGAATIASERTSLPEIVGDAGLLCDPHDPDSIASAMSRLTTDAPLRARLRDAARTRARRFTWPAAARQILALYEEARALPPLSPVMSDE